MTRMLCFALGTIAVSIFASDARSAILNNGNFETTAGADIGAGIHSVNGFSWVAENLGTEIQNSSGPNGLGGITMSGSRWGRIVADATNVGALNQNTGTMALGETFLLTGDVVGGPSAGVNYTPIVEFRRGSAGGSLLNSQPFSLADTVGGSVSLSYTAVAADIGQALFVRVQHPATAGGQASRGGFDQLVLTTTPPASPAPEPSAIVLALGGLLGLTCCRRRHRRS